LVEATLAAIRVKDSYFSALYHRVATRRGAKRAIIDGAHAEFRIGLNWVLKKCLVPAHGLEP
jgi:hypothetical protein